MRTVNNDHALIQIDDLFVSRGDRTVLDGVSLNIQRNEIVTVVGPNGAGKTTLVRIALGLDAPDAGTVVRAKGIAIGYVPQTINVDPSLPLTVSRFLALTRGVDKHACEGALLEVGAPGFANRQLKDLSVGEMRRALFARALLLEPDLLVLDEPTAGVDVQGQSDLFDLIGRIRNQRQCGVLLVSHDLVMVMAATDRVICLNHHICCDGRPEDVSRHP